MAGIAAGAELKPNTPGLESNEWKCDWIFTSLKFKHNKVRMQIDVLLKKLAEPAQRAIQSAGITVLEELTNFREQEILEPHGIGKNAVNTIESVMKENRQSHKDKA